ncbi:MAG: hypothetical protein HQL97_13335 [Magnetococcales bacterium]|nr:hypothetical protein [Magnetococcales bacterium]MBF0262805.1 hypothetical protein [Magnetococcales bacterium]
MTPEQHEQLIDHLFKRINLRGDIGVRVSGEPEGQYGPRGRNTKRPMEHVDPFALDESSPDKTAPDPQAP